jgi:hypothetical protein
MKPYQLHGLSWLVALHEQGVNGILADEMVHLAAAMCKAGGLRNEISCSTVYLFSFTYPCTKKKGPCVYLFMYFNCSDGFDGTSFAMSCFTIVT